MKYVVAVASVLLSLTSLTAGPLKVGFAEIDVSPEIGKKPVYMAGFGQNRKATKLHDPIMARAIVLDDGERKVGMVCVDVVGLFLPSVERVRAQLKGYHYVLVASSHNHEGPDTLGLWGASPFQSGVDPDYLKKVENGAAEAITKAAATLKPAKAKIGTAKGPELLRDGRLPNVLHDDLVAIRFESPEDGKVLGLLVEWNVHPELLSDKNTEVSADHVGYTVQHLKEKHNCPVAYFTGTVGGLMTNLGVLIKNEKGEELKNGTFEKTALYGKKVGELADKALSVAVPVELTPIKVKTKDALMPLDNPLYRIAGQAGLMARTMYTWEGNSYPEKLVESKDFTKAIAVKTEVGYLQLGELDVALIPGEIYPELVLGKIQEPVDPGADFPDAPKEPAIYSNLKGKHRLIIGLANDELGYFIPKRQWDEKAPFCYGLKKSQYGEINSVGPETGRIICETFQLLMK
jgi:hypothetical protein